MKRTAAAIIPALILIFAAGCSTTKTCPENVLPTAPGCYICTFDGVRHDFIVDLPENPEGSALILMLPGAGGTSGSFRQDTLFHEYACPKGYAVADEKYFNHFTYLTPYNTRVKNF